MYFHHTRINRVDGVMKIIRWGLLDWFVVYAQPVWVWKRFNIDTAPTIASAL